MLSRVFDDAEQGMRYAAEVSEPRRLMQALALSIKDTQHFCCLFRIQNPPTSSGLYKKSFELCNLAISDSFDARHSLSISVI